MTDESVVVDDGQTYVSGESAVIATEAADRAKQWAEESETQANLATNSANRAAQARDEAINVVNGFTQRVTEATNTFNSNATAKTNDFNNNATSKTNDFNTNATNKTTAFNNNASSKTTDFNNNATAKTTAFNNNYTEKKALIDAQVAIAESSATNANNYKNKAREWAISQNVVDNEDYSSKYWAGKSKEWAESVSSPVNKNLSNLNPQGQNIANWSSNVTNCITEIPQDIKLELSDGTLTLKAGSKVYVPNGAGVFDAITIVSDLLGTFTSPSSQRMFFYNVTDRYFQSCPVTDVYSGTTSPTGSGIIYWYDTANNLIKRSSNGGSTWDTTVYSLPFCLCSITNNNLSSIDQVFNGFGYIGSNIFVLPNVKGLVPNGRNEDGTLKNIEVIINRVGTRRFSGSRIHLLNFDIDGGIGWFEEKDVFYNEKLNLNYNYNNGNITYNCLTGFFTISADRVTSLTQKTAFHALDYNDSSIISGWAMPSSRYIDLNLGASGATYKAPANGYICLDKAGILNQYIDIINTTGVLKSKTTISASRTGENSIAVYMPCKKYDEIAVVYTATGTTNNFRFIYAEGENV